MPLHVSSTCADHQEVKIALHSLWYHHTETSEWSKTTKIQFYKYEQIVVKFMCKFFGCDYCVLLTINMLYHVEVMFIQLLNLFERYYVYLHLCLLSLNWWLAIYMILWLDTTSAPSVGQGHYVLQQTRYGFSALPNKLF